MYRTGLRLYVEAAFAARRNPGLLCQLERAQAHGWDRCPRCGARHVLECEVIH